MAAIVLVSDKEVMYKGRLGIPEVTHKIDNFFTHMVSPDAPALCMAVDICMDDRFEGSPLRSSIRFLAATPLVVEEHRVGCLCVFDPKPRKELTWTDRMNFIDIGAIISQYMSEARLRRCRSVREKYESLVDLTRSLEPPLNAVSMATHALITEIQHLGDYVGPSPPNVAAAAEDAYGCLGELGVLLPGSAAYCGLMTRFAALPSVWFPPSGKAYGLLNIINKVKYILSVPSTGCSKVEWRVDRLHRLSRSVQYCYPGLLFATLLTSLAEAFRYDPILQVSIECEEKENSETLTNSEVLVVEIVATHNRSGDFAAKSMPRNPFVSFRNPSEEEASASLVVTPEDCSGNESNLRDAILRVGGTCSITSTQSEDQQLCALRCELPIRLEYNEELSGSRHYSQDQPAIMSVLFVDDSATAQRVAKHTLEGCGCEVTIAENGKQGLALLKSGTFHVAFIDFLMPVLDGLSLLKLYKTWVTKNWPHPMETLLIGISASDNKSELLQARESGMHIFLPKPLSSADYKKVVKTMLACDCNAEDVMRNFGAADVEY